MKFAVVDLETTGGSPVLDRILEVGIVLIDGSTETGRFQWLVNPGKNIPPSVTLIHGISNRMVESAPAFSELADEIQRITGDRILVAHNARFDYGFLREEYRRLGQNFERRKICTVRLARKLLPGLRSHSLRSLCLHFSILNEQAHRALSDAVATGRILCRLLGQEAGHGVLQELLKGKSGINLLPPHLPEGLLENIPEVPGVYQFLDSKEKVIYVGKAVNLKDRVRQHFSGNTHTRAKQDFLEAIYDVQFLETGHELMALLLENELIKKHFPRFNSTLKEFRLNFGIFEFEDQEGFRRLVAGPTGKWSKPEQVFRTKAEATTQLLKISMANGLCLRRNQILETEASGCDYIHENGSRCALCKGNGDPENYNKLVDRVKQHYFHGTTILLQTPGRRDGESGLVWVEKGRIIGTGFIPHTIPFRSSSGLKELLNSYYDTQDAQSILRPWMEKAVFQGNLSDGTPLHRL